MSAPRQAWWALAALALASLTISLDATVINIALPTLAHDLNASASQLQWFSATYTLVVAVGLLPAGLAGDRLGRRPFLVGGLVLFGAASAACAFAGSPGQLIAARALLGLGAAMIIPLSVAVLPVLFTESADRDRAVGIWVAANAIGLPLGPILGGWLLTTFWWGSVFLINVPLTAVAMITVARWVPNSEGARQRSLDWPGVALSSLGLLCLTYGFIVAGRQGWTDLTTLTALVGGLAVLVIFVRRQQQAESPLIDLALFGNRNFRSGAVLASVVNFVLFGVLFVLPQYLQSVLGADALGSGLRLLPMIGGLVIGTQLAPGLGRRMGTGALIVAGFTLLTIALACGALAGQGSGYGLTAGWTVVLGLGLGFSMPTTMSLGLSALPAVQAGSGSALLQTLRQTGGAIGTAVLGAVAIGAYRSRLPTHGLPPSFAHEARTSMAGGIAEADRLGDHHLTELARSAFVHGMDVMLVVCAVTAAVAAVTVMSTRVERHGALPDSTDDRRESSHESLT